jgi:hypothetical protein
MAWTLGVERREELSDLMEEMARHAFSHRFPRAELTEMEYRYDPGGLRYIDEETGEECVTPARWLLLVTGVQREDIPE